LLFGVSFIDMQILRSKRPLSYFLFLLSYYLFYTIGAGLMTGVKQNTQSPTEKKLKTDVKCILQRCWG